MFIKPFLLSLALLVALVSAVHRDLSHRSHHHAIVARSSLESGLKPRDVIRRCKAHTSSKPKPTPKATTTSHQTTTTTKPKAAAAPPPPPPPPKPQPKSNGGGGGNVHTGGFATFFYQKGNPGACGTVHSDSDLICAMDSAIYGSGGLCGKSVTITNTENGKTVTVIVADECPTCVNSNSIDLSTGAFNQLASESEGTFPISWTMS